MTKNESTAATKVGGWVRERFDATVTIRADELDRLLTMVSAWQKELKREDDRVNVQAFIEKIDRYLFNIGWHDHDDDW